jgi:hypothetical protein
MLKLKSKDPKDCEFSKRLLKKTEHIFELTILAALACVWFGKDYSIFMYLIPSTAGIYGTAICFYLNKAKMENIFKGRLDFLKEKLVLMQKTPVELQGEIESEMQDIDNAIQSKVSQETNEAVQEDIIVQNY